MKNVIVLALLLVGCAPVKYVYIDPKDTTKLVEYRKRIIYEDVYVPNFDPFWGSRGFWGFQNYWLQPRIIFTPPSRPVITQRRR